MGEKRPRLAAALARLLRGVTQDSPQAEPRRVLLALDEFELVPDGPLKSWVLELAQDLDSALVLAVADTERSRAPDSASVDCPVGRLCRAEINEFAQECLPATDVSERARRR